jgi:hypothetical protein
MSKISRFLGGGPKPPEASAAPQIGLFGKHPGWGDFIHEDPAANMKAGVLGLCRHSLDSAIRRNIDEGRWRALKLDQILPWIDSGDGHLLVWKIGSDWLVGRLWPSHDSVGRAEWPMAVLAPVSPSLIEAEMATRLQAWLGNLKREISAATTPATVHASTQQAVVSLTQLLGESPAPADLACKPAEIAALLARPELGPDAVLRILYFMDLNLADFRPAKLRVSSSSSRTAQIPAAQLRVPTPPNPDLHLATTWIRFLLAGVDAKTSIFALIPDHQNWIDLSLGELTPASLFGLKTNLAGEPLTTEIPFELPPGFAAKAAAFIDACNTGQPGSFPTAADS